MQLEEAGASPRVFQFASSFVSLLSSLLSLSPSHSRCTPLTQSPTPSLTKGAVAAGAEVTAAAAEAAATGAAATTATFSETATRASKRR
jgi:hypothetical protein